DRDGPMSRAAEESQPESRRDRGEQGDSDQGNEHRPSAHGSRSLSGPKTGVNQLADGLGFEPKTGLRLYSISSAAPSTGLGHPSRERSLVVALSSLPRLPTPPAQNHMSTTQAVLGAGKECPIPETVAVISTVASRPVPRSWAMITPSGALSPPGPHWVIRSSFDQTTVGPIITGSELTGVAVCAVACVPSCRRHRCGRPPQASPAGWT